MSKEKAAGSATRKPATKPLPARKPADTRAKATAAAAPAGATARGLVDVGAHAPEFRAIDASGRAITLASLAGSPFVLYFYPKDETPGCTVEACDFRDRRANFAKLGCPVLGASPDSAASHKAFDAKHRLGITLLVDEPAADGVPPLAAAFGVWQEKSMYGRTYMGIVRTTYVIGADGRVAARFDRVKVDGHVDEVLASVRALA